MNKQELANKIWASANDMRSNIEAGKYKDYILGFLFYKFLSDKETSYLKDSLYFEDNELNEVVESDIKLVENLQNNIGYFISYENLYSTWLKLKSDFDVSNVTDALNAFNRNIGTNYKKVFSDIFDTLQKGISDLGTTATEQTKAIRALIELINEIPTDSSQGYDVLGFIYEYLISNFAANAGKKAGEFYTPHEISILMSEIISNHLKDNENISIYESKVQSMIQFSDCLAA